MCCKVLYQTAQTCQYPYKGEYRRYDYAEKPRATTKHGIRHF